MIAAPRAVQQGTYPANMRQKGGSRSCAVESYADFARKFDSECSELFRQSVVELLPPNTSREKPRLARPNPAEIVPRPGSRASPTRSDPRPSFLLHPGSRFAVGQSGLSHPLRCSCCLLISAFVLHGPRRLVLACAAKHQGLRNSWLVEPMSQLWAARACSLWVEEIFAGIRAVFPKRGVATEGRPYKLS